MIQLYQTLDLRPIGIPQTLRLSQYDSDFEIIFELTNFDGAWILDTDTTAEVQGTKTDGHGYSADAVFDDQLKTVTIAGDVQMTAAAGRNTFEIVLFHDGERLGSKNFILDVERAALDAETTASDSKIKNFAEMVESAEQAAETATAAAEAAEQAASEFSTDTTLLIPGKAADAKATGDAIAAVDAKVEDARIGADGTVYLSAGDAVRGQISDIKSDLDAVEDVLDIVQTEWTGTATHESSSSSPATTILDGLTLENGISYTFTVSIPSAISKVVYLYLADSGGTNIQTNSIAIGDTSKSKTFTADADYTNAKLKFGVALANVTATGVFTKNVTVPNAIDRLEADVASVTALAESTGSDLSKILVVEQKGNAFQIATDILDGRYYYRNSGALANAANAGFYSYIVKVIPHNVYTFNNSDIVLLDGDKVPLTSTESWDYRSVTTCNSGEAEYMAVNAYKSSIPTGGCIFSQGTELDDSTYSEIYYAKSKPNAKPIKSSVSGDISAGGTLLLGGRSAIKDGQTIVFKSKISSFDTIRLDFTGGYSENYVEFDATNLTVKNSSAAAQVLPHGLTIANEVTLIIRIVESHVLISLTSGGVTYDTDLAWNQTGAAVTEYQISTTGTVCTGAVIASTYSAARRRIWYFGDSYIAFGTDTRIPYYAYEYECGENICFSGASGGTSGSAVIAFRTLLAHGTPEFAVIATGMNDGGDSTNPASGWLSAVQNFISLCETEGITPVLCTVPTVPTVNNEQKNQWVRNSGYRYIDYASAVGADSSGVWYPSMIASDNIHPSTLGGNALFTQLATDLPEIFAK